MRRSLLLGLLIYGLILSGLIMLRGELLALSLPLVLYLLGGLLRAPHEIELKVERTLDAERIGPDEPVAVTIKITNVGRSLEEVLIEDNLSPQLKIQYGSARHLLRLPKGKIASWTYKVSGPRGYYSFPSIHVVSSDHLGLVGREQTISTPGQLFILPPVIRLRHIAIRPRRTRVYSGSIPARMGGPGVEFFGVREYQTGDSPRWINWRASAHHSTALFSNEFEQERVADVGIVLDGRIRTNLFGNGQSLFEHSVTATAALADAFLAQGNRVSLLQYGQFLQWTLPGYGKLQRERILQALAHAETGGSQIFSDLSYIPTQMFPAHSQVVLVSPLHEDDLDMLIQLRARGYQVLVISPDPVAFELSGLPMDKNSALAARIVRMERDLLLQRLQRAGIQLLNWDVSKPFDKVVQGHLGRPPAWMRAVGGIL